jgi:hypothetical protein
MKTRIALIHAVTVAIEPVQEAFQALWPEAEYGNILNDTLSLDRERDGVLTAAMTQRILALAEYAAETGAAGICSPARPSARRSRPPRHAPRSRC